MGVAVFQRQKQNYGGGAEGRALGHLAHLMSASPLVTNKAMVLSLSACEVRVPVCLLQHAVTQCEGKPLVCKSDFVCVPTSGGRAGGSGQHPCGGIQVLVGQVWFCHHVTLSAWWCIPPDMK